MMPGMYPRMVSSRQIQNSTCRYRHSIHVYITSNYLHLTNDDASDAKLSYPDAIAEEDADRRQQDGQQDLQERLRPHCRRARRLLVLAVYSTVVLFYSSSRCPRAGRR